MSPQVFSRSRWLFSCRDALVTVGLAIVLGHSAHAALFQHLDASVTGSFINNGGVLTWLDQSGNGRNAVDTSAGSGSVSLSTDPNVFPTGLNSIRFDGTNFANYGRLDLFNATVSDAVLDQSGASPTGFSYEGYGNKYLDLLCAGTTEGGPTLLDGDADFDGIVLNDDPDDIAAFVAAWGLKSIRSRRFSRLRKAATQRSWRSS